MSAIMGMGFGKDFCDAVGLDVKGITDIRLNIPADGAVTLDIVRFIHSEEVKGIIKQIEQYQLHPKGDIK